MMSGNKISPDELWQRLRQWLADNPEPAKKEFAIALRGNGFVPSIEQAVVLANGGYDTVRRAPDLLVTFGRRLQSGPAGCETRLVAEWCDRSTRRELRARLSGGIDLAGTPYLIASGEGCAEARREYAAVFPATMGS